MEREERIDEMIEDLRILWKKNPEWRLGQMVCNIGRCAGYTNPYYIDDQSMYYATKALQGRRKD